VKAVPAADQFEDAFAAIARERPEALLVLGVRPFLHNRTRGASGRE
jgi:hypothetical protein